MKIEIRGNGKGRLEWLVLENRLHRVLSLGTDTVILPFPSCARPALDRCSLPHDHTGSSCMHRERACKPPAPRILK